MVFADPAFREANRANWDERVPIHRGNRTGTYRISEFLAGDDRLHPIEDSELGPVDGARLLHLQCHFGLDTLRLARRGARVTGVDFSPAAIAEARALAARIGRDDARFVESDVYAAAEAVKGRFDIVFTTWGTICWLPDLDAWARVIAAKLAPGGRFYFADGHPFMLMLEEIDGRLVPSYPQDTPPDRPLVFEATQTYTGDRTPIVNSRTYEWVHSISRLLTALDRAGLAVEWLREHSQVPWPAFPMCVPAGPGMYRLPPEQPALPLALSLTARLRSGS
ncbi:class I SAM-dependent methyltransferase [Stella sp.]|jgi:SAM-dependent methyltransferase|uniref:class I SAM-dependent methyltransferase n=1 Tax=Stella sp. TaxID=2912054 RepID=UPI0035AF8FB8